ncbi:immunity 49 family protein [Planotetraspora phitsanulokensis]|uniref:immunity 49 family protein n=1 Tax=Planotetraspora phitsanulokensis TaxID=575192 RepID=UPI00194F0046|nr:immunity 49 family protein [Planotetraspora phitsanulokensis]
MRIERHRVSEAAVSAAREDFTNRIGSQVRSMSKAGPMTGYEWQLISEAFLNYLGALSVETPDLDTAEAKAVLENAAEAAAGAVQYAAYHSHDRFSVFLDYVNFGVTYEPESEGKRESVSAHEWIDAFCLAVLCGKTDLHGEAFHFARKTPQEGGAGRPAVELINGLMAYVIGDTGDTAEHPPPSGQKLAALDAALARIRALDDEIGEGLLDHPQSTALHALRAMTTGDLEAFRTDLETLLIRHSALAGSAATPESLLPLLPLALTALAYRREGWQPPIDTGYLPRALVTGFETTGPRVQGYGRDRRPGAVAELAAGPVVFERPEHPQHLHPESEALFEQYTREAFTPPEGRSLDAWRLKSALNHQDLLFKARASLSADVTDLQMENLRLASQLGAALFRITRAEPGTDVEVTIDGRTLTYPAYNGSDVGPGHWHTATNLALITGVREDLAPLVLAGSGALREDGSAFASYRRALHDYLRGAEPEPATDQALADSEKAKNWGFFPPPAVLFSQLVEGDEESFNLALLDALTAHRDHYAVADRADDSDAAINLDILALTCHARRRGWTIRVVSPYLPARLLQAAVPR